MNEASMRQKALMSVQRALLDEVGPTLRGVGLDWGPGSVQVTCYFDGPVADEDRESMECMHTEVIASFPEDVMVSLAIVRVDFPARLDDHGAWAYRRRESGN